MKAEIIENYIHRRKVRIMKRNGKVFKKTLGIVLSAAMLVSGMTFMPGMFHYLRVISGTV